MNAEIDVALNYHNQTKHSYSTVRNNAHILDWSNRPLPFKIYETLEPIPLPKDYTIPVAALDVLAADGSGAPGASALDLAALARLFYLSNGVTRTLRSGGETHYFRAASCTGALYHIELYLVCGDLPGVSAGVYHYGAHDHALRQLRAGDYRERLVRATAQEPHVADAPAIVVCTDTFWRNTWKYQARAYRHSGGDNGVILANLLAVAAALDLPAEVVCGFADAELNRLLALDGEKEVTTALVALGRDGSSTQPAPPVTPLDLSTTPLSRHEVAYPLISQIHAASSLPPDAVAAWRIEPAQLHGEPAEPTSEPAPLGAMFPLVANAANELPGPHVEPEFGVGGLPRDTLDAVIKRRGSSRRFTHRPISLAQLSAILSHSTRGVPADFLQPFGTTLNDLYLIASAVDGLPSGAYVYHRDKQALEQLRAGDFRSRAGYLDLEQALAYDAAVNIYYLADLSAILQRFGNRGYRAVQLEAGILGGKVYLAAYALRLGATGLTFYDDDVIQFFSPHAAGKSAIFLMTVGHPK